MTLDEATFASMRGKVQNKRDVVITSVIDVLVRLGKLPAPPDPEVFKVRKELRKDPSLASYFPGT
ncbi:MAG: hypothetical protein RLZZ598_1799 [Pseudomonadota bacterium]